MENALKNILIIAIILLILSCDSNDNANHNENDYRELMREFVIEISEYSKSIYSDFIIIPQNGIEIILNDDESPSAQYLEAIDGNGQEDLFYGYHNDNEPTPEDETANLKNYLDISKETGNIILVTDYCSDSSKITHSYQINNKNEYISFAATDRELNNIPDEPANIFNENMNDIHSLDEAANFLYLLNPENFSDKNIYISSLANTNYDILIIDLFFNDIMLNTGDINKLRTKPNDSDRLVIAYMSIGEAEDYRYYWDDDWNKNKPDWIEKENPNWKGNYKVKYWFDDWKNIIIYAQDSYLNKIINSGFDGVYLDIIDAYEYYE